jgi:hypothetical protein
MVPQSGNFSFAIVTIGVVLLSLRARPHKLAGLLTAVCLSAVAQEVVPSLPAQAPSPTTYSGIANDSLSLYAWPGRHMAFLTERPDLDRTTMRQILDVADSTWDYYAKTTRHLPKPLLTYNGLATVAQVPRSCPGAAGCTYIGATGMELVNPVFPDWLYKDAQAGVWDQVFFYEMGRSFWAYPQWEFPKPSDSSCIVTGFAVLMRYRSINALGLRGSYNQSEAGFNLLYAATLGIIDRYAADPKKSWANTFLVNNYTGVQHTECADLFASLMLRLAHDYGGQAFLERLFRDATSRPLPKTAEDAAGNFEISCSNAAQTNLTALFHDQWRWPVPSKVRRELKRRWGDPIKPRPA